MKFGKIIGQAMRLTWGHKVLWFFGALPTLIYLVPSLFPQTPMMPSSYPPMNQKGALQSMSQLVSIMAVQCLVGLASLAIAPVSIGGMVKGVQQAIRRKKLTFRKLFQESLHYYWRLFLLPLLSAVFIGIAVVIFFIVTLLSTTSSDQGSFPILLFCSFYILFIIGVILLGVVFLLSNIGIVVEDLSVGEAIGKSWGLLRSQISNLFVATIIYGFIGFSVFAIIYAIYFGILFAAVGPRAFQSYEAMAQFSQGWIPKAFVVIFSVVASITSVFFYALWTQTYQQLSATPTPKRTPRRKTTRS